MNQRTVADADHVRELLNDLFDQQDVPGMSVAIVDGTEPVLEVGFGNRQIDPQAPATAETLYGIGSSTKPITATAVMSLVDRGRIALEDRVASYVPHFEDVPGDPITLHELLSHTSGMPSDDAATIIMLDALGVEIEPSLDGWDNFQAYVEGAADRRRIDGDRCLYYNTGYVVLSRIVEAVTGKPFDEFVRRTVFEPLEMETSTFDVDALADDSRETMTPYRRNGETLEPARLPYNPAFEAPGGLLASVADLVKFLGAWNTSQLPIAAEYAEMMYDSVAIFRQKVGGWEQGYGYGWMTRPFKDDLLIGHGGGTGVSAGYLGFLRDRGLGIAIGCNAQASCSPEKIAVELLAELTGTPPESVLPDRAVTAKATRVTGRYESYQGIQTARVEWTGERLNIEYENPMGGDLMELAPTSVDPTEYTFQIVEGNGGITRAEFSIGEDDMAFLLNRVLFTRMGDLDSETDLEESADSRM